MNNIYATLALSWEFCLLMDIVSWMEAEEIFYYHSMTQGLILGGTGDRVRQR